jgi:hypothetical protein
LRRIVAGAASLAALAALAASGVLGSRSFARRAALVERLPDTGEDYFSAIEQPHKIYEWPWLRDQKFQYPARVLGYGPPETWDRERDGHLSYNAYMGWNEGYRRAPFDEVRAAAGRERAGVGVWVRSVCPHPASHASPTLSCSAMLRRVLSLLLPKRDPGDDCGWQHGDRALDVDMRPAQSCYDDDSWDCYREQFDANTGYLLPSATEDDNE